MNSPLVGFTLLLLVILTIPPIFERLRLPGLVGLLVAGVFLGPDGLGILDSQSGEMSLLSDIGKIYLMFVAGLEIDLADFRRTRNRALGFGVATFLVPLLVGTVLGRFFGFGWNGSILIGSLLASHTLLGYPIVQRLGVVRNEAVTVTIGATIFTDIAALMVLAICVSTHAGGFSPERLIVQLGALGIYAIAVLFGLDWAGKAYFRRSGDDEANQFLFVLLAVFLAAVGAQVINTDKIVGAFLAGLAVNDVVGRGPVEEKVVFVGSTLFIPFFFVNMGLLLNVSGLVSSLTGELLFTLAIVVGLLLSKLVAAMLAKGLYRYRWNEGLTMWSLSLPQVAATLAATLTGVNVGLLNQSVFNAVIVLMLITSVLGPVLTARFAYDLPVPQANLDNDESQWGLQPPSELGVTAPVVTAIAAADPLPHPFTVVVPVANPHTERYLIETGALLARHEAGVLIPLAIARAHAHMDAPEVSESLQWSRRLLERSLAVAHEFRAQAQPVVRVDDDVASGISRVAREQDANLIVMGWSSPVGLRARLFGTVTDGVFWSAHCPVAVMRLLEEPIDIHRILVPIKSITPQALRPVRFAQLFADTNQAAVTLLHVCDRHTSKDAIAQFESELWRIVSQSSLPVQLTIQTVPSDDAARTILEAAQNHDLVVLRSLRRRTAGGLAVSDVTTQVLREVKCSVVLFGEPHFNA